MAQVSEFRKGSRAPAAEGLPSCPEVERLILGAVIVNDDLFAAHCGGMEPDDFSLESHRRIFRCIAGLIANGERIDRVVVAEQLRARGELESCGGLAYLVDLDTGLPANPRLDSYVVRLKVDSKRRQVMLTCEDIRNRAALACEDLRDIVDTGQEFFATAGVASPGYKSLDDLPAIDADAQEIQYVHEHVLVYGGVTGMTGESGHGKSTVLCAMAKKSGVPVILLDRENPRGIVVDRFKRLRITDLKQWRIWGGWCETEAPLPDAPIVLDWVKSAPVKPLVIVDALSGFHPGDQNDAGEMRKLLHRCRRVADAGAAVGIIHHSGKSETSKDYRGSSDFIAALDIGFHVTNLGVGLLLDKVVLRAYKHRYGFSGELVYSYCDGLFLRAESSEAQDTISERLTAILRLNPNIGGPQLESLAAQQGVSRTQVRTFLLDGMKSGYIRQSVGTKNAKRYALAGTWGDQNAV